MLQTEKRGDSKSELLNEISKLVVDFMAKHQPERPENLEDINVSIYLNVIDHNVGQGAEMIFGNVPMLVEDMVENENLNELIFLKILVDG